MLPPYSPFYNIVECRNKEWYFSAEDQLEMQNKQRPEEETIPLRQYRKWILVASAERNFRWLNTFVSILIFVINLSLLHQVDKLTSSSYYCNFSSLRWMINLTN